MGFLNYFKNKRVEKNSAHIAKERLQIIVAHQRNELSGKSNKPAFITKLQEEILEVLKKYVHVDPKDIKIEVDDQGDCSVLELNVTIPEESKQLKQQINT
ncbi:cell division topological specificity factor MinE [Fastidiosibacter lacustris]|uniref:cell division topological specificity factor MinE n=1 Tax=Fastidiosibacter lacustris TaxID=2056695 RepID=UPI000E3559C9|nr:cell division topological specificity factor MinE [Fastidiosibacter lacustris]